MTRYIRMWVRRLRARNLTAGSFERAYSRRSGVSINSLREHGRYVAPCDCDEDICDGWEMAFRETEEALEGE